MTTTSTPETVSADFIRDLERRLERVFQGGIAARNRLAELAGEGAGSIRALSDALADVAESEGEHDALTFALQVVHGSGARRDLVITSLAQQLTYAPQDDYSGRGNDAVRSRLDGYRAGASWVIDAARA